MLLNSSQDCSKERLSAELRFGETLLKSAMQDSSMSEDSDLDAECSDWCESVAFAINFAFDGEARSFLDTLGHRHWAYGADTDSFQDWQKPWSNAKERIQVLTLHIRLLEKWFSKLDEKFSSEAREISSILSYLRTNGCSADRFTVH